MRKGEAFLERAESAQDHWKEIKRKVHPALLEMAQLFKECIQALGSPLSQQAPQELAASIEAEFGKRSEEIKHRYSGAVQLPKNSFPCEIVFPPEAKDHEGIVIAANLHWERFKIPLAQDIEQTNKRDGKASRRIQRTVADYEAIRCDQKKPEPFKGKVDHSNLFQLGLGPLGLQNLTAEELAIFFDRFCPGCRDAHNGAALRTQRTEFLNALAAGTNPSAG